MVGGRSRLVRRRRRQRSGAGPDPSHDRAGHGVCVRRSRSRDPCLPRRRIAGPRASRDYRRAPRHSLGVSGAAAPVAAAPPVPKSRWWWDPWARSRPRTARSRTRRPSRPRAGAEVVKVYSPNATWSAVREALDGASIVVYLGHGNGWPSRYRDSLYPPTQNGFGLNPVGGGGDDAHQYFGEASGREAPARPERGRRVQPPLLRQRQHRARACPRARVGRDPAGRQLRVGLPARGGEGRRGRGGTRAGVLRPVAAPRRGSIEQIWRQLPDLNGDHRSRSAASGPRATPSASTPSGRRRVPAVARVSRGVTARELRAGARAPRDARTNAPSPVEPSLASAASGSASRSSAPCRSPAARPG